MVWRKYCGILMACALMSGSLYGCAGTKEDDTQTKTTAKETAQVSGKETAAEPGDANTVTEDGADGTQEKTGTEAEDVGRDEKLATKAQGAGADEKTATGAQGAGADEKTGTEAQAGNGSSAVSLTFWTYPVGGFEDEKQVQDLVDDFCKEYPDVSVDVHVLDYSTGDDEIAKAIESGEMPDLVFEGPERLVANWGSKGLMVPLDDLWEEESARDMYIKVSSACRNLGGTYYEYPLGMMVHIMALNRDVFEKADALQYLDEETGTWKSEDFEKAVSAVHDYLLEEGDKDGTVCVVYCKDQGGDQGTRALVTNYNSGLFTNDSHTEYTLNSDENIQSMKQIVALTGSGLAFDDKKDGGDEITEFCEGNVPMTLCWNCSVEKAHPDVEFEILPVTFPSDDGIPELCGGIYGFGIFDNKDTKKIEAAKDFIRFFTSDPDEYKKTVRMASAFPVMDNLQGEELSDIYEDDEVMDQYVRFMQYFGDYYQVVPGWPEARTAWFKMLQELGAGADVEETVASYDEIVDEALEKAVESNRE